MTIVVGGQYGSEGKGKVVALLSRTRPISCVVRCGGPNSGHTTSVGFTDQILRHLPSSVAISDAIVAIAAGAVVDESVLVDEITDLGITRSRVIVDPRAATISEADKVHESPLTRSIASTGSGTGSASSRRLLRSTPVLAANSQLIARVARIEPVAPLVHDLIRQRRNVIVEGTQGFGLSLLHGPDYPYVTSKDTTAAAFAAEVGISPRDVSEIVMVIRTFPIRVGGNSGPIANEINWKYVQEISGAPTVEPEYTSVTKKLRRVAMFDLELVRKAFDYNKPTSIAVMGLDRLDYANRGAESLATLTSKAVDFLSLLKAELRAPIDWVGTGFGTFDAISLANECSREVANVN